ncbi:uncharacterized protein C8A04DRAFT_25583 [Dichotomopilus funicola]|uniref:Uncharacterized protein n=1 Tax=Dichotomopilus funicola TaxID=1934379 RepID=A0AAN6ZRN5_9PEZI|nr:hypothetical protein C8A04DRAFT_25583 [Dichotomopilus funicola]
MSAPANRGNQCQCRNPRTQILGPACRKFHQCLGSEAAGVGDYCEACVSNKCRQRECEAIAKSRDPDWRKASGGVKCLCAYDTMIGCTAPLDCALYGRDESGYCAACRQNKCLSHPFNKQHHFKQQSPVTGLYFITRRTRHEIEQLPDQAVLNNLPPVPFPDAWGVHDTELPRPILPRPEAAAAPGSSTEPVVAAASVVGGGLGARPASTPPPTQIPAPASTAAEPSAVGAVGAVGSKTPIAVKPRPKTNTATNTHRKSPPNLDSASNPNPPSDSDSDASQSTSDQDEDEDQYQAEEFDFFPGLEDPNFDWRLAIDFGTGYRDNLPDVIGGYFGGAASAATDPSTAPPSLPFDGVGGGDGFDLGGGQGGGQGGDVLEGGDNSAEGANSYIDNVDSLDNLHSYNDNANTTANNAHNSNSSNSSTANPNNSIVNYPQKQDRGIPQCHCLTGEPPCRVSELCHGRTHRQGERCDMCVLFACDLTNEELGWAEGVDGR